jgi:DNA polymerase-3 subunit beta
MRLRKWAARPPRIGAKTGPPYTIQRVAMKTVLPRQEFQDALAAVASLTGGRTTKPILACVKLKAGGETIQLSATDGEASLNLGIGALSISKKGETVVPADKLLGIVRELADVEITLESDDRYCTISGEGSQFRIFTMSPADFPPVATFDDEPDLIIDGHELRRMIGLTVFAAAKETSRYAINGVLWEKQGKKLFLIATDGRRLARAGGEIQKSSSADFEAIVPAKALSVFEKVFQPPKDGEDWMIHVKVMPNQVMLRSTGRVLSTVLVEGHFPKYQDVIPKGGDKKARLERDEFLAAVRRAALLTTEESRAVKLAFESKQLVITSQSPEQGDARVQMPIGLDGSPIEIGFNPAFLQDALRAVSFDSVYLEMSEAFRPGVLTGEDKSEFLYVVMPVSLSQ